MNTNTNNHRPALALYHSTARCTGCAVKMTLHPATVDASGITTEGYIELTAANQMTVSAQAGIRFDWENAIVARLDFRDVSQMLQVFRGECKSINDGKGICHMNMKKAWVRTNLRHIIDPVSGYYLELCTTHGGTEERRARFIMNSSEALGICEAFASSMRLIAFGE